MKIRYTIAATLLGFALGAPATLKAQDTTVKHVAHNVSSTVKKAGRDIKAEAGRDAAGAHRALKANGNAAKDEMHEKTGIDTMPGPVNNAARAVSHTGKTVGAKTKHAVKATSSSAHHTLKKAGNKAKAQAAKDTAKIK